MKEFKRTPQIVFLMLGALLLAIAFFLTTLIQSPSETTTFWTDSIKTIAFIILTIVIVDIL